MLVLEDAAHVHQGQAQIQEDQGPGPVLPAPADPQHITEQKYPEAGEAPRGSARSHQPGRQQRSGHGGSLQPFDHLGHVASPVCVKCTSMVCRWRTSAIHATPRLSAAGLISIKPTYQNNHAMSRFPPSLFIFSQLEGISNETCYAENQVNAATIGPWHDGIHRHRGPDRRRRHRRMPCRISAHCMGMKHSLFLIPAAVKYAVHAVALNEHRGGWPRTAAMSGIRMDSVALSLP